MPANSKNRSRSSGNDSSLQFEQLQPRQLLAADSVHSLDCLADVSLPSPVAMMPATEDSPHQQHTSSADFFFNGEESRMSAYSFSPMMMSSNPIAMDDELNVNHGETAAIIPSQLLANDTGDSLTVIGVSNPVGGSIEFRDSVAFFTPDMGHHVLEMTFDYTVADSLGTEASATATLVENDLVHGPDDSQRGNEHSALFSLIDTYDATNVAIQDGDWSDPNIWSSGVVPTANERVLIHHTLSLAYDVQSDVSLDWLRIDGILSFQTDADTRLLVETIAVDPRGTINIGTANSPVETGVSSEILIDTSGGALSQAEDPLLQGRGFISHGNTNFYGAEKREFTTLSTDALSGDPFIELSDSEIPAGWQIGDTLLLAGTDVNESLLNSENVGPQIVAADADNARFRDELLEVTSFSIVDGQVRILFNNVTNQAAIDSGQNTLLWNHTRPDGETFDSDELSIHVANLSRNIVIRSSDPAVEIQERGHFMVMHNNNAEIHHAQFRDLGRSDKRQVVDDPAAIGNFDGSPGFGTNPRGRYGLHLHRLGANDLAGQTAMVTGNVVWGSPGWGIVQHDSHAVLEDNIVFDVVGAGIVAEDGNELGLWRNNLVVKTTGDLVNSFDDGAFFQSQRGPRFDLGFFGSGYWVQGGGFGIRMEDNIAASTNAAGFDLVHHTDGLANVEYISVDLISDPDVRQAFVDGGFEYVTPNNVPTRGIDGLVSYNGFRGIHTWLHNRDSGDMEGTFSFPLYLSHDFRSTIENYTIWGVQSGIQNFYSTRFDFVNGLIVGDVANPVPLNVDRVQQGNNTSGLGVGHNHEEANNISFTNLRLEGFEYGFQIFSPFNEERVEVSPYATSELSEAQFANVGYAFIPTNASNPASQADRFSDLFILDEVSTFQTSGPNAFPTAAFNAVSGEGLSVVLNAAGSFDPDPSPQVRPGDDGIAAYAWDLDNDGEYDDAFGQTVTLNYDSAGSYVVGLKVWDGNGASTTTSSVIDVNASSTSNPFVNADFSDAGNFEGEFWHFVSGRRNDGWIARDVVRNAAGFAEIGSPQYGIGAFGQIVRDQHIHRGEHTFSFDAIATDGQLQANLLQVRLFGVNGQFDLNPEGEPSAIHIMAEPEVATLVDVNIGLNQINSWETQSFDIDLGSQGYEYLVIAVRYQGYNVGQGDYFALDNFMLDDHFVNDQEAPQVQSVLVNQGEAQRSHVTELTVNFSEVVFGVDSDAFVLMNTTTNSQITPNVSTELIDGRTVATLTFSGNGIIAGSLPDGEYQLTILSENITDGAGNLLDGNGDGIGGDNATDEFFRLFGDIDGNGNVNIIDFFQFKNAFGPTGTYNSAFDFDDDGVIDILDFFEFRNRFGHQF